MRLIDHWFQYARRKNSPEWQLAQETDVVSFVVDNVAWDYFHSPKDTFVASDFPYAIPPWERCFIEWVEPDTMLAKGEIVNTRPAGVEGVAYLGGFVATFTSPSEKRAALRIAGPNPALIDGWDAAKAEAFMRAGRGFTVQVFSYINGVFRPLSIVMVVLTTDDGLAVLDIVSGEGVDKAFGSREDAKDCLAMARNIICSAFTFANCKNVERRERSSDLAPRAKVQRRLKLPSVKRYTLDINGASCGGSRGDGGSGGPVSYHLCRGHFATYTEDKKLFGRHVGRFWIPPHTKGKREAGVVDKGYRAGGEPAIVVSGERVGCESGNC